MITPTNGRMVWIYHQRYEQPLAATITWVHSDTLINVCCFFPDGTPVPMKRVALIQDTSDSDINAIRPYAAWMPYQKAVAKGEIPPVLHAQPDAK